MWTIFSFSHSVDALKITGEDFQTSLQSDQNTTLVNINISNESANAKPPIEAKF